MKNFLKPLILLFTLLAALGYAPKADARSSVSFSYFYDNLDPYGEWVEVSDYGYCWHPTGVDADWAPYSDGYWAYTDSGWTWVSYEDFGGITYHYGRWVRLEDEGWCWVPDYEWAPAWVSWRSSSNHIGWAPLPPRARFHRDLGISVGVDVEFDIGPAYYNFCEVSHFGDPALRPIIIDRSRNVTIINETTNITNITINKTTNNVFVGGPQFQTVSARSSRPIPVLKLRRQTDATAIRAAGGKMLAAQQGNELVVLAPEVTKSEAKVRPQKVARKLATATEDHGWKGVTDPEVKQQLQTKIKTEAKGREKSAAKPVQPEELQVVQDKLKGDAAQPTSAAEASPAKGKNKKAALQPAAESGTETIVSSPAPILGEPKTGKNKKGRGPTQNPEAVTPQAETAETAAPSPAVTGKGKKAKAQMTPRETMVQEADAVSTPSPMPKSSKKGKPGATGLQPFNAQPAEPQSETAPVEKKSKRNPNAVNTPDVDGAAMQVERQQRLLERQQQNAEAQEAARARRLEQQGAAEQRLQQQQLERARAQDAAPDRPRPPVQRRQLQQAPPQQITAEPGSQASPQGAAKGKKKVNKGEQKEEDRPVVP
ncbi:MAG: hypothetical protein QOD99_1641 [Chthoniobacter sp.]|jgi:hypothetical protein|nr:hypothetical protein [Chthoniobacter sp.]